MPGRPPGTKRRRAKRSSSPSDPDPRVHAIPVFDGDSWELQEFFAVRAIELGRASARHIRIRPFGEPAKIDKIYEKHRSAERKIHDEAESVEYRQAVLSLGDDERLHVLRDMDHFARNLGIPPEEIPCLVFATVGKGGSTACLKIKRSWYQSASAQRAFSTALQEFLSDPSVVEICLTEDDPAAKLRPLLAKLEHRVDRSVRRTIARSVPSDRKQEAAPTPLVLLSVEHRLDKKPAARRRARLVGHGQYHEIDKIIGERELYWLYLLFESKREHVVGATTCTVVSEQDAVKELRRWQRSRYLRVGASSDHKTRVKQNWHEFVRQMEKKEVLRNLFVQARDERCREVLYGICLSPAETRFSPTLSHLFPERSE